MPAKSLNSGKVSKPFGFLVELRLCTTQPTLNITQELQHGTRTSKMLHSLLENYLERLQFTFITRVMGHLDLTDKLDALLPTATLEFMQNRYSVFSPS